MKIFQQLSYVCAIIFCGAGKDIKKPKLKGSRITHLLDWLDYAVSRLFDRIDTKVLFQGRGVRTKEGRVRSNGERRLVNFFDHNQIVYQYEPTLVLGRVTLHPDFYLPEYKVYVEFWGMVDISKRYCAIMGKKKALFRKHSIPVISIYPRHLSQLPEIFPKLLEEAEKTNPSLKKGEK